MNRTGVGSICGALANRLPRRTALLRLAAATMTGALVFGIKEIQEIRRGAAQTASPPSGASAFVVVRRYQRRPDASIDELVRRIGEGFVPIIRQIPGFKEYVFVDAGDRAHMTMSLYDTPSGAEQSTRDTADWAAQNVAELLEGPPEVSEGWVRLHIEANGAAATPAA